MSRWRSSTLRAAPKPLPRWARPYRSAKTDLLPPRHWEPAPQGPGSGKSGHSSGRRAHGSPFEPLYWGENPANGSKLPPTFAFRPEKRQNGEMRDNTTTKISPDGLRYRSRASGSPFAQSSGNASMSCAKCGLHKPRSLGSFRKLAGKSMFVCGDCVPPKPATPAAAPETPASGS